MMIQKYQGEQEGTGKSIKPKQQKIAENMMKQVIMALMLWGAFTWSHAMAQTQEQGHQHEQQQESKGTPADKGLSMKDQMKQKMKEKLKDMKCCPKEEQKQPKS